MVLVMTTSSLIDANKQLDNLVARNKGRGGQYKYAYITKYAMVYGVALSKEKPTGKQARSIRRLN